MASIVIKANYHHGETFLIFFVSCFILEFIYLPADRSMGQIDRITHREQVRQGKKRFDHEKERERERERKVARIWSQTTGSVLSSSLALFCAEVHLGIGSFSTRCSFLPDRSGAHGGPPPQFPVPSERRERVTIYSADLSRGPLLALRPSFHPFFSRSYSRVIYAGSG